MNAQEIAAKLTKAQREALTIMPDPPFGLAYPHINGQVRVNLFRLGLLEYQPTKRDASPKMCLTPLGLAVRQIIQEQTK